MRSIARSNRDRLGKFDVETPKIEEGSVQVFTVRRASEENSI